MRIVNLLGYIGGIVALLMQRHIAGQCLFIQKQNTLVRQPIGLLFMKGRDKIQVVMMLVDRP